MTLSYPPTPLCHVDRGIRSHPSMQYILYVYTHLDKYTDRHVLCSYLYTGQFWNIPINVVRYNETIDGTVRSDTYTITVNYPGQQSQFVGFLYPLTWEFDERQCLYVGNGQGGPIDEVDNPNDPVLQGEYTDYIVDDLYGTDFAFGHFVSSTCSIPTPTITPV